MYSDAYKSWDYYVDNKIWLTKTMCELPISSMEFSHIINCLWMCRTRNWRTSMIPVLLDELRSRGFAQSHPEYFL